MSAIHIKDQYADVLLSLGDPQAMADEALRQYTIGKINERVMALRQKIRAWEEQYGCSFDLFAYRTATDEEYVKQLNATPATRQWEGDLIAWEHYDLELKEWYRRLESISTK
jgi:hypothetical protein